MRKTLVFAVIALMAASAQAAIEYDLTYDGAQETVNGAIFMQWDEPIAMGSGLINSFLGVQGTGGGSQHGYNTTGDLEFDTKTFSEALLLSDIPTVTFGVTKYREFWLDINQNSQHPILSLDEIIFYQAARSDLTGYSPDPVTRISTNLAFGAPIYDLDKFGDNYVTLDYRTGAGGSGKGDMLLFVPDSLFIGAGNYIYLYSMCGDTMNGADGFEEWAVGNGAPIIPEPATICLLGLGALGLLKKRRA